MCCARSTTTTTTTTTRKSSSSIVRLCALNKANLNWETGTRVKAGTEQWMCLIEAGLLSCRLAEKKIDEVILKFSIMMITFQSPIV